MTLLVMSLVVIASIQAGNSVHIADDCDFLHEGKCYTFHSRRGDFEDAQDLCWNHMAEPVKIDGQALSRKTGAAMQRLKIDFIWTEGALDIYPDWRWVKDYVPLAYQGCYDWDQNDQQDWRQAPTGQRVDNPTKCAQYCQQQEKQYSSLRFPSTRERPLCSCGDHYDLGTKVSERQCGQSCPEDGDQRSCGGDSAQAIYNIDGSSYFDWVPGVRSSPGACMVMSRNGWKTTPCIQEHPYICQYDFYDEYDETICRHIGGRMLGNACISVHREVPSTWHFARHDCCTRGGDLLAVTVKSAAYEAIKENYVLSSGESWWLGLSNRQWHWTSDYMDMSLSTDIWLDGHPVFEAIPTRQCVAAKRIQGGAGHWKVNWVERACESVFRILCQSGSDPDWSGSGSSGSGDWTYSGNHIGSGTTLPTTDRTMSGSSTSSLIGNSTVRQSETTKQNNVLITGVAGGVAGAVVVIIVIVVIVCVYKRCPVRNSGMDDPGKCVTNSTWPPAPHSVGSINPNTIHLSTDVADTRTATEDAGVYETLDESRLSPHPVMTSFIPAAPEAHTYEPLNPDAVYINTDAIKNNVPEDDSTARKGQGVPPSYVNHLDLAGETKADRFPEGRLASASSGDFRTYEPAYLTLVDDSVPL